MAGLVRVNTRIGEHHNDWLDAEAKRTGMSKSGLIQLAVDSYMQQNRVMFTLEELNERFVSLEKNIEKISEIEVND